MSKEMNPSIKDMLDALENDSDFRTLKQKYESPNEFTIMAVSYTHLTLPTTERV